MKIISVVGARPNFMKISPFIKEINKFNKSQNDSITHILVHTGQHYDDRMSKAFFKSLNIPDADINLGIGSGTHAEQVGMTMIAFEKVLLEVCPDWIVVLGDVNATLACSVTAKKLGIKVCHIEAGLRSGDELMPEEINRLVTDRLSDLLLTPDRLSNDNLKREGVSMDKIKFVGNIMIDTLDANIEKSKLLSINDIVKENIIDTQLFDSNEMLENNFALMTMHRPSNVDTLEILKPIVEFILNIVSKDLTTVWTVHPRTQKQLKKFNLWNSLVDNIKVILLFPLDYHSMLKLNMDSKIMFTDSGGLQEECTVLGTPCITLRWNTERPITLRENGGASVLVGNNIGEIEREYYKTILTSRTPQRPDLWDGNTASRCLNEILEMHNKN
jgi:UDP-N-acetylglucosamine 2-epimerase (non-hydrolysing)